MGSPSPTIGCVTALVLASFFWAPGLALASDLAGEASEATEASEVTEVSDEEDQTPTIKPLDSDEAAALRALSSELRSEIQGLSAARDRNHPLTVSDAMRLVSPPRSAGDIFGWIRENIEFEPYSGSLRGAEGTLIARAANSVDQTLLAAAMLDEAGIEYRFVTGRLHREDAERILGTSLGSRTLFSGATLEERTFSEPLNTVRSSAIQSMQDHLWLEAYVREEYRPFDPIAAPAFGMTPATSQDRHAEIPARYRTTMEVKLVGHLEDGQRIDHLTVAGPLPRYAYRSLSLRFEEDTTRRRGHRPVLTIDGVSSQGQTIPVASLKELELRYSMRMGERETRWQQTLYKRDQGTDIFDFDLQHFSIAIIPGWTSINQVRALAATNTTDALDSFDEWLQKEQPESDETGGHHRQQTNAILDQLGTTLSFSFAHLLDRTSAEIGESFGVAPVLTRPRVITTGILRRDDRFLVDLQLHSDRIDALPRAGIPAIAGPAFLGMYGRLRDQLIGEMLQAYAGGEVATVDKIFRGATSQSIPITTIDGRSLDRLTHVEVDDSTKDTIRHQIRRRSLIVLTPLRSVQDDDVDRFGWWALDPVSGVLEAHTGDALLTVGDQKSTDSLTVESLLRGHLRLVARQFTAASHATAESTRFPELTCSASRQLVRLGRAYCATSAALPRSNIDECLDRPPQAGGNLFSLGNIECRDRVAPFRCASVYADAVLTGQLQVGPSDATPQSLPAPRCY